MRLRRTSGILGLLLASGVLLAGCSEDDKGPDIDPTGTPSVGSESPSDSESVSTLPVPEGVELTEQGSMLTVGDTATVAYEPRQGEVGVLDITVTRLEKAKLRKDFVGWNLDEQQKKANPYFVRATVTNRGETDLGGRRAPLYIVDATNTLVEATPFASLFRPCQPGEFPKRFKTGRTVEVCLVFLAPNKGDLTAVSFRPSQDFDPITWTGPLEKPLPPEPEKGKGKGNGDQDDEDDGTS